MRSAGLDLVGLAAECTDRAGQEAGPVRAGVAREWRAVRAPAAGIPLAEENRRAIGVPQPVLGVDEDADRRGRDRLGTHGPALERPVRRALEPERAAGRRCRPASVETTRRVQEFERIAVDDRASGLRAKVSQPARPTMPSSSRVRAGLPVRERGGSRLVHSRVDKLLRKASPAASASLASLVKNHGEGGGVAQISGGASTFVPERDLRLFSRRSIRFWLSHPCSAHFPTDCPNPSRCSCWCRTSP